MQKACCTLVNCLDQSEAIKRHLSLLLRTFSEEKCLISGKLCHEDTIRAGHDKDIYLSSLIVDLYGKCGALYDAKCVFTGMEETNIFLWNCLISTLARQSHSTEALQAFEQILQECVIPNSATFANVVAACASKEFLKQGIWLHARSQHTKLESYVVVQTALIRMYHKCGKHDHAQIVFEATLDKDIVSWNSMLSAFILQGDSRSAWQLFAQMQMECVLQDKYTYGTMFSACCGEGALKAGKQLHTCVLKSEIKINRVIMIALINMYWKCGSISNAKAVFHASPKQDIVIWSAIFTALSTSEDNVGEIIKLFDRLLEESLLPNKVTFLGVLAECSSQGAQWHGRQLHVRLLATKPHADLQVETALLHMYGKLGIPIDAALVFKNMFGYDTVSWNAMITVLSQHGFFILAFQNFQQMQQEAWLPDKITFTSVLSGFVGCVSLAVGRHPHALVESTGLMKDVFVGNALVNMYFKCGAVDDALELFNIMDLRDIISWNSLMAGYSQNGNTPAAFSLLNQMCVQGIKPDQVT